MAQCLFNTKSLLTCRNKRPNRILPPSRRSWSVIFQDTTLGRVNYSEYQIRTHFLYVGCWSNNDEDDLEKENNNEDYWDVKGPQESNITIPYGMTTFQVIDSRDPNFYNMINLLIQYGHDVRAQDCNGDANAAFFPRCFSRSIFNWWLSDQLFYAMNSLWLADSGASCHMTNDMTGMFDVAVSITQL
jgi:hypothetical protein